MIRLLAVVVAVAIAASDPAVPVVRLDAVVTDGAGRAIVDLRPADFELRDNGVARPIESVELRPSPQGSRIFALFLDEYHVAAGAATGRVQSAVSRFVAERLRPGDRAAVIKPLDRVTEIPFASEQGPLQEAIASFAGRKGDYTARTPFEQEYIGRAPAAVEAARRQIVSSALREIALRLGELSAERAVIVVVSEGFSRTPSSEQRQMRIPDLQALVRAAGRFHLSIYGFNPADGDAPDAPTLEWLAAQTGGRATLDAAALDAGLQRLAADLDSYYAITYRPAVADGRFHPVQLTTKRRNAVVRTRPGYWSPLGSELRAALEAPTGAGVARRALRRSPRIDAWTGVSLGSDGRAQLSVTWEPKRGLPAHALQIKARSEGGDVLFDGEVSAAGSAAGGDVATFAAPAGRVELDMTIVDIRGSVLDTDSRDVPVPDLSTLRQGPVLLTPAVIRARTAPEYRAISSKAGAAPSASRAFTRGDRLLLRMPAWDTSGAPVEIRATITNASGGVMRTIERVPNAPTADATFDLPLAWLAPGEYAIVFSAPSGTSEISQTVRFSVR